MSIPCADTWMSTWKVKEGTWLFIPLPDGCRWSPIIFSSHLREVNKKAGLVWSCLDFRHTFGSHLAMKGESLYKISKIMGNSPQVCQKHYAALMPESLYESAKFEKGEAAEKQLKEPVKNPDN